MADERMLQEAIEAIREEKFERARDILTRLLRSNQNNPTYWLWMSAAVQTPKEKRYCLETVLRLDPEHELAKQGLALMGLQGAGSKPQPLSLPQRNWKVDDRIALPELEGTRRTSRLVRRAVTMATLLILLVIAAISYFLFAPRKALPTYLPPTRTPGPPPTFTPTPTYIGFVAPPTTEGNALAQPTPLWMLLDATYTPTPLSVNTPHPISEAFRAGLLAYQQGEWETAIAYFQQAQQLESQAADIPFYLGEAYRQNKDPLHALEAYRQALRIDARFAPALLGRARANQALDPNYDALPDLNQALQIDPNLAEAYLERAGVYLKLGEREKAMGDIEQAEKLLPSSPLPPLLRAKLFLQEEELEQAYQEAQRAFERDRTLLESYRLLGEVALRLGKIAQAQETLGMYLDYEKQDGDAYLLYARALIGIATDQDLIQALLFQPPNPAGAEKALQALDRALALDKENAWAHLYRSCIYLTLAEGQKAVNDLSVARRALFQTANAQQNPLWFAYHLALSRALLQAERLEAAEKQFNYAAEFAKSNFEKAALYYWRGKTSLALEQRSLMQRDWNALLQLPPQQIPPEWLREVKQFLTTPTPTSLTSITPAMLRTPSPSPVLATPTRTTTP